ncbi:alpha/beta hydrolase [Erysipelothrix inopinata]|uniref:Alpha/beta hydrolase n=1 Tax=Erysipelothrix inopinata TaxID=225084 RepID=A0A7G9RX52_9FIRM|nr:alpha/beta hydrolase [Erysipelothrix inopinata]QNN60177.1 alpha/beta hydrolase [Erysipelothrix inopinata]
MVYLLIVIFILIVVLCFAGNFFYNLALNRYGNRDRIFKADHNVMVDESKEENPWKKQAPILKEWVSNHPHTDVYLLSFDNLQLYGLEVRQTNFSHKWFIGCHGYGSQHMETMNTGKHMYEQGFNILVPDARGHGNSEGHYIGMGWDERRDIVAWIKKIVKEDPEAEIMLYGISMGGATVMMTSGESLPENVKVIVEDCGYESIEGIFSYQLKSIFNIPSFPVLNFASFITKIRAGFWFREGSALEQVKKSRTPILFIHGDADTFVPSSMVNTVYEAATCPKELLIIPNAGHAMSQFMDATHYYETIDTFIQKYI